jgi:alpha-ribazole phosphatase
VVDSTYFTTTIDLLRHGECEDGHCYRGTTDVALSNVGHQQMMQSIEKIVESTGTSWSRILSSPLQRCFLFAEQLAKRCDKPLVADHGYQEIHFGDWEGQSVDHIWETQQVAVEKWFADPVSSPPPNGEPVDVFSARVITALLQQVKQAPNEHMLLVTHGGVIRALLAHCLSMSLNNMGRFDVPYASFSRIQISYDFSSSQYFYRLIAHNINSVSGVENV